MNNHRQATTLAYSDKAPPHSPESEKGVLGSLLLDPRLCDDVASALHPEEFYSPAYRKVYECMLEVHNSGKQIDTTLIIERLQAQGDFEMVGGMAMLLDLAELMPTAVNAVYYAGIIREFAIDRELAAFGREIQCRAEDRGTRARDKLAAAEQELLAIAERRTDSQVSTIGDVVTRTVEGLYERRRSNNAASLSTPWQDLNRRTGGMRNGELWVLGGRPRMGKTSAGLSIADHVARSGRGVLFVSLEMGGDELCEKLLAARTAINSAAIRDGRLTDEDMSHIVDRMAAIGELPMVIDDTPSRTVFDIASQARRLKRQGKLALLVIDHLGLIVPDNHKDPRHEQVSKITRRLKVLARELQIPILALSQLNREVEKDRDHRPRLSSLRESGSIEQDAGVVLFIHREEEYRPDDADLRGKAELIVAKTRAGEAGTVPLVWLRETQEFRPAVGGELWQGID